MTGGIGVKQVIGANIVLVDAPFNQAHTQNLGVKAVIFTHVCGNGGQMVNSSEIHGFFLGGN
jgi:hypothetical protein